MRDEPWGRTLFCDDIREETGAKLSLIGVYAGQILIQRHAPFVFPLIAAFSELSVPRGTSFAKIAFSFRLQDMEEGGKEVEILRRDFIPTADLLESITQIPEDDEPSELVVANYMRVPAVPVARRSRFKMRATIDDGPEVRIGTIPIDFSPPPDT